MSRSGDRGRGAEPGKGQPDNWVASSKAERVAARAERQAAIDRGGRPLSMEEELNLASMDTTLPSVDFHGMYREDVAQGIDLLLAENPGRMVRIIFGYGTGAIAGEVMSYLHRLSKGKRAKIDGYRQDVARASCVVKVKE